MFSGLTEPFLLGFVIKLLTIFTTATSTPEWDSNPSGTARSTHLYADPLLSSGDPPNTRPPLLPTTQAHPHALLSFPNTHTLPQRAGDAEGAGGCLRTSSAYYPGWPESPGSHTYRDHRSTPAPARVTSLGSAASCPGS